MGGGAMLPAVSGGAAYCASAITKSSTAVTTTNLDSRNSVSVISCHEPFNKPSTGLSCVCHENVVSPLDVSGTYYSAGCVFGTAPSKLEVEKAMTDLQRFLHGEAKSDFHWLQPIVYPSNSTMLQSPGYGRIHDAFSMLQREPSVQNMVVSISCDKAVWDAILNNRAVQDLRGSISAAITMSKQKIEDNSFIIAMYILAVFCLVRMYFLPRMLFIHNMLMFTDACEEERTQTSTEEADIASLILKWILGFTKSKIVDVIEKIGLMVAELFLPVYKEKPTSELTDLVEDKIRSSLLLSVVILLIVVVTRNDGT